MWPFDIATKEQFQFENVIDCYWKTHVLVLFVIVLIYNITFSTTISLWSYNIGHILIVQLCKHQQNFILQTKKAVNVNHVYPLKDYGSH